MTTDQLIQYIRMSVNVQEPDPENPTAGSSTSLTLSDDEILLYLNVVLTRDFSEVPSLDYLPSYCIYPLTLLCKKELYWSLAVKVAPQFDLGADNNNYLKRSQLFDHYKTLAEQADEEYKDYLENGGGLSEDGAGTNTLSSFDVLLPNRYYTKRYYDKGKAPAPLLYVDRFTTNEIEVHWKNGARRFAWCNVYASTKRIVDPYQVGNDKIVDRSTLIQHFLDSRQVTLRLSGLEPDTEYYLAIEVVDMSSLVGYAQVVVTTEALPEPEPETVTPPTGGE